MATLRQHQWGELHRIGVELQPPKSLPAPVGTENKGNALEAARADHGHALADNVPLGIIATGSRTSNFTLVAGGQQDITDLSITFTTIAGRRYRCSANFGVSIGESNSGPSYAGLVETQLVLDGNQVDYDHVMGNHLYLGNSDKAYLEYVTLTAPTAASHTWKVQARYTDSLDPGVILASAIRPAYIVLEDIGA